MKKYKDQEATERNAVIKEDFDASATLLKQGQDIYLEIVLDKNWLKQKRNLVTAETLTNAIVPDLPFENVDGSTLKIETDYLGKKRNMKNPSPGPFEIKSSGKQKFKVW